MIFLNTVLAQGEGMIVRGYARRHGNGGMMMNAITALFASLFFLVTDKGGFNVPPAMLPLALLNACLFGAGFYFTYVAYRIGPYGLTRLLSGFYVLFTVFYGIVVLKEPTTPWIYLGIVLILVAMVLINGVKAAKEKEKGVSVKWLLSVLISLAANGFIGILTRMQQLKFENACSNEFQFISIGGSFVFLALLSLLSERKDLRRVLKTGSLYGLCTGVLNGAKNFITLAVYLYLPLSVVSPMSMGLGFLATFATAIFLYKEKYTLQQYIGIGIGVVAILLLSI
ncbi:MAG: EamA family transporter [Clostridia bacterium]|nr:EamA family transporter [Clostridia bacterium]